MQATAMLLQQTRELLAPRQLAPYPLLMQPVLMLASSRLPVFAGMATVLSKVRHTPASQRSPEAFRLGRSTELPGGCCSLCQKSMEHPRHLAALKHDQPSAMQVTTAGATGCSSPHGLCSILQMYGSMARVINSP